MMKKVLCLLFIICIFVSCASFEFDKKLSIEEASYLESVEATSTVFKVSSNEAEEVWSRIQAWIAKYSGVPLKIVSKYIIETEEVIKMSTLGVGYRATRAWMDGEVEFSVRHLGTSFGIMVRKELERNCKILAYYALTGKVVEKFIYGIYF